MGLRICLTAGGPYVQGQCEGPAPEHFYLTEPLPHGACAILVEEDFLDAPLGTSCVLLDSLYVAVAAPGPEASSVLLLQVCPSPSPVAITLITVTFDHRCHQGCNVRVT